MKNLINIILGLFGYHLAKNPPRTGKREKKPLTVVTTIGENGQEEGRFEL